MPEKLHLPKRAHLVPSFLLSLHWPSPFQLLLQQPLPLLAPLLPLLLHRHHEGDDDGEEEAEEEPVEEEVVGEGAEKEKASEDSEEKKEQDELVLANAISQAFQIVHEKISQLQAAHPNTDQKNEGEDKKKGETPEEIYHDTLLPFQFAERSMKDTKGEYVHHYKSRINSDGETGMDTKMRRLTQELGPLSTGLPLYLTSSVFLRVDEERIDIMQALITGPTATPYGFGCFQFDIYCPSDYPNSPPVVNLQTTGNGSVRFNPNLYNCGKVCLSLLGTWSGSETEKWNSKTSTLLQVLVSIQSFILVEKPYFNEPGYERSMGTKEGDQQNKDYNDNIQLQTIRWAMIEQLRNPSPGFEDVITNHFKLNRNLVMKQALQWLKEASTSPPDYQVKLKKTIEELKKELQALNPDEPLDIGEEEKENKEKKTKDDEERIKLAAHIQDLVPGLPLPLVLKSLEINQGKADEAVNWLLEQGQQYLLENPSLLNDDKDGDDSALGEGSLF
eukprot:TRINITY_DN4731_c0_g6_i1.p2 TRINITY_DN4731_c0_g6~~TRINITY_DN4731_c0_g6_i1.p2  ORF type:complete len:502 (-),score=186.41 TRINITY_DN4731_c0_g6_i1:116-1621(-)